MSAAPPLSVVMPVHNGMPYVDESVRSILGQTFGDFEFVIGDDGSNDGTAELLQARAREDSRIRLLRRESRSGLAASANWVVSQARAPLVAVAHADDLSNPDRLRRQLALLEAEPDAVLSGTLWDGIDETGRRVRSADHWSLVRRSPFAPFLHSSIMFRRDSFERVGGYRSEAEYWEDLDLYLRLAEEGRILVLTDVLASVRHSMVSARLRNSSERVEEAVDLMYRSIRCYRLGGDYARLLRRGPRRDGGLDPRTFIACGTTRLWSGRSPAVLGRMWRRARLRPDLASLHTLVWVLWGTASPKSLRLFLKGALRARTFLARPVLGRAAHVEWKPRKAQRRRRSPKPSPGATDRPAASRR